MTYALAPFGQGQTLLMHAAHLGHRVVAQLLLSHGADAAAVTEYGMSAVDYAEQAEHDDVVTMLRAQLGESSHDLSGEEL